VCGAMFCIVRCSVCCTVFIVSIDIHTYRLARFCIMAPCALQCAVQCVAKFVVLGVYINMYTHRLPRFSVVVSCVLQHVSQCVEICMLQCVLQ